MLSNAPSSSSKFGLSLVAGLALLECQIGAATAQSKFPSDLVGSWCSINYEGEGIEISKSSLEEGDGVCHLRRLKIDTWVDNKIFELTMSCDTGVEGKKSQVRTERFSPFQMEGRPHMLRAGGMYNPKNLSLYKRCE
jgi:hypothetical protein